MTNARTGILISMVLSLLRSGEAAAWTCDNVPGGFIIESDENPPTEDELMRNRSLWFAKNLEYHRDGDVVVVGQFFKKTETPFLHEQQLEEIRAQYWPVSEAVQMPYQIEYTYLGAYRFEGHQLVDGRLIPFVAEDIDARVSISSEYEGVVDLLPPAESKVLGVLQSYRDIKRLELTTSICPTYHQIQTDQLADLLQCFADGACQ